MENNENNQKTINKIAITTYLSINTSNVNGLNTLKDLEWLGNR